jgi:serine-type D-Ala-D-Ala carboxypeptidase (penicillin-binding protein 5/6)
MLNRRFIPALLAVLLVPCAALAQEAAPAEPAPVAASSVSGIETAAKQAFLIDASTGAVLLNKAGDEKMHPSSMSKLMTMYVTFSRLKEGRLKLDSKLPVSEKAWATQGSKTFVHVGDEVGLEDLIKGIVVQSGNDACIVVAEAISGSEEAFAEEMNRVASDIGLTSSHFVNATGLPDDSHQMSPRDLAKLALRIITDFPEFYHYYSIQEFTYNNITQHNRNRLLGGSIGVDGLKTGHTEVAGFGITLSAKQGERRVILVINGLESDKARMEEGDKLLRWAFREFENKTLLRKDQQVIAAPVWMGRADAVPLVASRDVVVTLPISVKDNIDFTVKYNGPIPAPIEAGAHIADLIITPQGGESQTVPLVAGSAVEKRSAFGRILPAFRHYIGR